MRVQDYRNDIAGTYEQTEADLPVAECHSETATEDYDVNFVYPVSILENTVIRLEPLIPSLHARPLYEQLSSLDAASSYKHCDDTPPKDFESFLSYLENHRRDRGHLNFVIFDKTEATPRMAGLTSYTDGRGRGLRVVLGHTLLPACSHEERMRTIVTALLLQYALTSAPAGLGLRHVGWEAWSIDSTSIDTATRLGFKSAGVYRNFYLPCALPSGQTVDVSQWYGQMTFEDWRDGASDHVKRLAGQMTLGRTSGVSDKATGCAARYHNRAIEGHSEDGASSSASKSTFSEGKELHLFTVPEAYDLNFCWSVPVLEDDFVRVEPFIPSLHGRALWDALQLPSNDGLLKFMTLFRPGTFEEWLEKFERKRKSDKHLLLVILDKRSDLPSPRIAGLTGIGPAMHRERWAGIGPVIILSEFQRTHVCTHSIGLLLWHCFSTVPHGWGLRTVRWSCSTLNSKSENAAVRFGFKRDLYFKFAEVLSAGAVELGIGVAVEGSDNPARHDYELSITSEDWFSGGAEKVAILLAKRY